MNELEMKLLAAILKGAQKENADTTQEEAAIKQINKTLKKADLSFIVLATSKKKDFVATSFQAKSSELFVMIASLFEEMAKEDLEIVKELVSAEIKNK